jgi:hypothetical protein
MHPEVEEFIDGWLHMELKTIARAIKYLDLQDVRILCSEVILTVGWSVLAAISIVWSEVGA